MARSSSSPQTSAPKAFTLMPVTSLAPLEARQERLGRFLRRLVPVAAAFGAAEAWAAYAYSDRAARASAAVILSYAAAALVAERLNARGRTALASALAALAITLAAAALVQLQPELHPALALVPLLGAALSFPYLAGRELGTMLSGAVVATAAIALIGEVLPPTTRLPILFGSLFRAAATTTLVAFVAYFLWQNRTRHEADLRDERSRAERLEFAIAELSGRELEARRLSFRDPLTGLANRRLGLDRLEAALAAAAEPGQRVALLFIDLDHFKAVNDQIGHAAGDEVLGAVALALAGTIRGSDTLARFGGDEFLLVMPKVATALDVELVARRLLERLSEPMPALPPELHIAASLGLAVAPDHGSTPQELLRAADRAMYRAKGAGGARFAWAGNQGTIPEPRFSDSGDLETPAPLD